MKTLKIALSALLFTCLTLTVSAQDKSEKFKVSGNCGMCKNKIEKAAKAAGATYASWDEDTKQLEVKYSSKSTNSAKILGKIAETGYDNEGAKATDEAYNKLHGCCKYDRSDVASDDASCCEGGKCTHEKSADCCADGKCVNADKGCCVDGKCTKATDCCKDGKCSKHDSKKAKRSSAKA
jgi:periplasmic mercuric ion binding protein